MGVGIGCTDDGGVVGSAGWLLGAGAGAVDSLVDGCGSAVAVCVAPLPSQLASGHVGDGEGLLEQLLEQPPQFDVQPPPPQLLVQTGVGVEHELPPEQLGLVWQLLPVQPGAV